MSPTIAVLPSHLRYTEVRNGVFWFVFEDHGSNSSRYRVLNLDSDCVKDLGVSSLFEVRLPLSLLEEMGVTERGLDGP